jgi:hypothetical protein
MNAHIFWDIVPCSSYVNRRFGAMHHIHLQGQKLALEETSVQQVARQNEPSAGIPGYEV